MEVSNFYMQCNSLSLYISAETDDGEEKMISQGKCISYLVALLVARKATV